MVMLAARSLARTASALSLRPSSVRLTKKEGSSTGRFSWRTTYMRGPPAAAEAARCGHMPAVVTLSRGVGGERADAAGGGEARWRRSSER